MTYQTTILEEANLCGAKNQEGAQGEEVEVDLKERAGQGVERVAGRGMALAKASPTDRVRMLGTSADHLGVRNHLLYLYLNATR